MGMQVNTNLVANNAYRNLSNTQNDLSKSLEKLSSGLRINRAADDAAGLAISEGLKSQVGGLTVAARNAQDGISVLQTAEGSLNEVTSILQRMRDLAVQAGNDSNSEQSRDAITTEVVALNAELVRIKDSTNFNGTKLLDGATTANPTSVLNFQVGADGNSASQIGVSLASSDIGLVSDALKFGTELGDTLSTTRLDVNTATILGDPTFAVAAKTTPAVAAHVGTAELLFTTGNTTISVGIDTDITNKEELAAALNADADFAGSYTADYSEVRDATGTVTSTSLVVTARDIATEANDPTSTRAIAISLRTAEHLEATTQTTTTQNGTAQTGGVESRTAILLGFDTAANAQASISAIDAQITAVSTARAELGAYQNRFESVIKNLAVSKENLTAAGSRIRDTDMASEMVNFTRANILAQAGTAMLAQANQSNQGVLQLLQ
ncbi:flagellin [Cryobacterium sp. Hh11]|uniref:flagellin N-terminal helical domain-containing protein n=1 Tax=Cryobacterium sp. Hh11 TaxID=2555868 RepID=UPI00106C89FF|nr:flagellin [Cryobacterium sp. Hh11]TFD51400.1 flagellin [Cryobacterium sp. Hh11]